MSAYKILTCSFKDKQTLLDSLKTLGFNPIEYKEKRNLQGYKNDLRQEKAEIIVPKNQISYASNDLGFMYDESNKEYLMICSEYDSHRGLEDKVKQSYALTAIKAALKKNKFLINSEDKHEDKKIIINASKVV